MTILGIRIPIGENRLRLMRVAQNFTLISFPVTILTFFTVNGLSWWWITLAIPVFVAMYLADPYMVRGESNYQNNNNPQFQDLCDRLKRIERKIDSYD